jgi:hypothetical protein
MDDAPEVLRMLRQIAAEAPDELGIMANLMGIDQRAFDR